MVLDLRKYYPELRDEQIVFLEGYSFDRYNYKKIEQELQKIDISKKYSDVQRLYKECERYRVEIQEIRKRYNASQKRKDDNSFEMFFDWFKEELKENKCGYCGITQEELNKLFNENNRVLPLNEAFKRSSGTLEIERKDSKDNSYKVKNLIFACPLCNNAKSNLIDHKSWEEIFAKPMKAYYEKLLA